MVRLHRTLGIASAAVLACSGGAHAQLAATSAARSDFGFLWGASVRDEACPTPLTAEGNIFGLNDSPVSRHCKFLYQHMVGIFPEAGPHQIFLEEGFMEAHIAAIRIDIPRYIPDPNYDGPAVIDFEGWYLNWERTKNDPGAGGPLDHDLDFQQDWEDYIREHRPELIAGLSDTETADVIRQSYEVAAMDFYIATIEECKRLRPQALWGFYNYPPKRYYSSEVPRTTPRTIGYGNHTHLASELNDRLARLWEACDALYPSTYANRVTVPDGVTPSVTLKQNNIADDRLYIASIIEEALRLANGKPVYNVCWMRYQNCGTMSDQLLNEINIRNQCEASLAAGSYGLIWWDGIEYRSEYNEVNTWLQQLTYPLLDSTLALRPPPDDDPVDDPIDPVDPTDPDPGPEVGTVTYRPDGSRVIVGTSFVPGAPATAVSGFVPDAPESERAPVHLTIVRKDKPFTSSSSASSRRATAAKPSASKKTTATKQRRTATSRSRSAGSTAYQVPPRVISSKGPGTQGRPRPGQFAPQDLDKALDSVPGEAPPTIVIVPN